MREKNAMYVRACVYMCVSEHSSMLVLVVFPSILAFSGSQPVTSSAKLQGDAELQNVGCRTCCCLLATDWGRS